MFAEDGQRLLRECEQISQKITILQWAIHGKQVRSFLGLATLCSRTMGLAL
jgi:hypothetical protein